jgi:hypothetical protein
VYDLPPGLQLIQAWGHKSDSGYQETGPLSAVKRFYMQQIFAHEFMHENKGCYSREQLDGCSFMKGGAVTLVRILESEIALRDKYWFICKKLATIAENQAIAIRVAEIVLPMYEARYPDVKAPRECIEAAKAFLLGTITVDELLKKKRAAAAAAYAADFAAAAAYAADFAAAAAYAADFAAAAAYAAYAAADFAAYAAAAAAYAAAAAAYAAIKTELHNYLLTFIGK